MAGRLFLARNWLASFGNSLCEVFTSCLLTRPMSTRSIRTIPRPGAGVPIIQEEAVDPPLFVVPLVDPADAVEDPPIHPANPPFVPPGPYFPPQGRIRRQGSVRRALPPASNHSDGSDSRTEHESSDEDRAPRRRGRRYADVPQFAEQMQLRINTLTADLMAETMGGNALRHSCHLTFTKPLKH